MLDAGCVVTLGTDDPVQFNCVLQDEYDLAEALGIDKERLRQMAAESRI
jgi:adenosine deaminase